ncbi:MAG TPA: hypothetical protein VH276_04810 [Solirubrobacteraceae bacterium]|jgi:hypothetical protein|nr:hypothetical protein [Solirubrobacteraceae bacterium]
MSESEVRGAAIFYDHELEDGHATGRRRRPAADWGVGEELFDHMPSRRRFRAGEPDARHEAPRRDPHARTRPAADFERPTDELELAPRPEAASGVDAAWMAELVERSMPAPARRPEPAPEPEADAVDPDEAPHAEIDVVERPAEGRRTVVIRGRGADPAPGASRRDRRPPRTVGERLGPRPDRVAAWAVALGVLLILIAILTAH